MIKALISLDLVDDSGNVDELDEDLCEVDTHTFMSLIENGRTKEKEGNIKGALKHYNEAAALYKGDFLPKDLYAPWIELRREELRNAYISLLKRIATLHENKGAMSKAISFYKKVIQISPLLEDAYQRLMVLYSNIGKRNEALKIYERLGRIPERQCSAGGFIKASEAAQCDRPAARGVSRSRGCAAGARPGSPRPHGA